METDQPKHPPPSLKARKLTMGQFCTNCTVDLFAQMMPQVAPCTTLHNNLHYVLHNVLLALACNVHTMRGYMGSEV